MEIKKESTELVERLVAIHAELEDILSLYLGEYATYGWDSMCTELTNTAAGVDIMAIELKHAKVQQDLYR